MNKITDGVGKKIVDALKQQSGAGIEETSNVQEVSDAPEYIMQGDELIDNFNDGFNNESYSVPNLMSYSDKESFAADLDGFDVPANVAILKQLINQLPSGVSKQTGAQIIKQTMEALGISMKAVLQEAQQVQENLNNSAKECQASVMEHRKQIGLLEKQAQKFQKQSTALNDVISLFVQTNL